MKNCIHKDHEETKNKLILNSKIRTLLFFQQIIYGLLNKKGKLLNTLTKHFLQIIRISEHHLNDEELEGITLHSYT